MEVKKIDITSSMVEKGIDMAKSFLDKLIIPPIEEAGLLLKEKVTFWKFKNQVNTLNKAKTYCEKKGISPKTISLKVLCPLLDYSALEEDEELQDKWAVLLGNMVDSEQNIQNHVFPYILSQISRNEFEILNATYQDKIKRQDELQRELNLLQLSKGNLIAGIEKQIEHINQEIKVLTIEKNTGYNSAVYELEKKRISLTKELRNISSKESHLIFRINQPEEISINLLKEFEISNLLRLGLIKYIQRPFANSQTLEIPFDGSAEYRGYIKMNLDVEVDSEEEHILSELGELFIQACSEKTT